MSLETDVYKRQCWRASPDTELPKPERRPYPPPTTPWKKPDPAANWAETTAPVPSESQRVHRLQSVSYTHLQQPGSSLCLVSWLDNFITAIFAEKNIAYFFQAVNKLSQTHYVKRFVTIPLYIVVFFRNSSIFSNFRIISQLHFFSKKF